jgi:sugar phosphate permease
MSVIARFLMGVGSVAGFLGAAKMIRYWFDNKHYTKMMGLTYTVGFMGAVYGGKPVRLLIEKMGWQNVLYMWVVVGMVLVLFSMSFIRDRAKVIDEKRVEIIPALKMIFANKQLIMLGISGGLLLGLMEGFADIWGIAYFRQVYQLSVSDSAFASSLIYVGICVGGLAIPYATHFIGSRRKTVLLCCFGMFAIFSFILIFNKLPYAVLLVSTFLIGIFLCYQVLMFAIAVEMVPTEVSTITAGTINMLNMIFGFVFHYVVGLIVDSICKSGIPMDKLSHVDYSLALSPILIGVILGTIIFAGLKFKDRHD